MPNSLDDVILIYNNRFGIFRRFESGVNRLIFKINRLRNLLQKQMNAKEVDWAKIEIISKELDLLIQEYYKKEKEETK